MGHGVHLISLDRLGFVFQVFQLHLTTCWHLKYACPSQRALRSLFLEFGLEPINAQCCTAARIDTPPDRIFISRLKFFWLLSEDQAVIMQQTRSALHEKCKIIARN